MEPEIIADLNNTPVGKYHLRKCITKTTDENGRIIYSVREYSPRPFEEPTYYVPSRGVNLTEENMKQLCNILRKELYDIRHIDDVIERIENNMDIVKDEEKEPNTNSEKLLSEDDIEDMEEDWNNIDPCLDEDCETELDFVSYGPLGNFTNNDSEIVQLSLISWHNKDPKYDLRVWTNKINSRGYEEYYPELDKGLQLDDIEAERLCQEIEKMFPEVLEETKQYIEDNYEEKADTFVIDFTDIERKTIINTLEKCVDQRVKARLIQNSRGSNIGEWESHLEFIRMNELIRKIKENERMSDKEYDLLRNLLIVESETSEINDEETKICEEIYDKITEKLLQRKRISCFYLESDTNKQVSMSAGECRTASKILDIIYNELYNDEPKTEHQNFIKDIIDSLAIKDIEERHEDRISYLGDYKTDAGKHFLKDLILALDKASNQ